MAIDAGFTQGGERLAERLKHAGDHEIAAELHGVGLPRAGPGYEGLASDGIEHRVASLDEFRGSASDHDQLLRFGCFGTPENRRAQVALSAAAMLLSETPGHGCADGAAGDVDGPR